MGKGINKVILVGNMGADPEVRHTGGGTAVCTLNLATSESWTDKQSGEKVEKTEWHRVKLFGKLAEIAGDYLKKGRQVYIEGSLRTDKYTDKAGVERYSTDIIASDMQMLGGGQGEGAGSDSNNNAPPRSNNNQQQRSSGGGQQQRQSNGGQQGNGYGQQRGAGQHADASHGTFPDTDDEIPFVMLGRRSYW